MQSSKQITEIVYRIVNRIVNRKPQHKGSDMKHGTAIRTGDKVEWDSPQFSGGSFFRGRSRGAKFVGHKRLSGTILRHSYGAERGQHTFTVLLANGERKLVKGRNLYPNLVSHTPDANSIDRISCD